MLPATIPAMFGHDDGWDMIAESWWVRRWIHLTIKGVNSDRSSGGARRFRFVYTVIMVMAKNGEQSDFIGQ